jgi:hypothetical protein
VAARTTRRDRRRESLALGHRGRSLQAHLRHDETDQGDAKKDGWVCDGRVREQVFMVVGVWAIGWVCGWVGGWAIEWVGGRWS